MLSHMIEYFISYSISLEDISDELDLRLSCGNIRDRNDCT